MAGPSIKHILLSIGYATLYYVAVTVSFALSYLILFVAYKILDYAGLSIAVGIGVFIVQIMTVIVIISGKGFGIRLFRNECREIYELIDEVAQQLDTHLFDRVYIVPHVFVGVVETNVIPFLPIRRRNLVIGWLLLTILSQQQLKAVIAHELAHFYNNAMFLHNTVYRIRLSITNSINAIHWLGVAGQKHQSRIAKFIRAISPIGSFQYFWNGFGQVALIPYFGCLDLYLALLNGRTKNINYEAEYYCDSISAAYYGSNVLVDALRILMTTEVVFELLLDKFHPRVKREGNLYPLIHEIDVSYLQRFLEQQSKEGSLTHPSISAREAKLEGASHVLDISIPLLPKHNSYTTMEKLLTHIVLEARPQTTSNLKGIKEAL